MESTKRIHILALIIVVTVSITSLNGAHFKHSDDQTVLKFEKNVIKNLEELLRDQTNPTYFDIFNQRTVLGEAETPIDISRKSKSQISKYFISENDVLDSDVVSAGLKELRSQNGEISKCSADMEQITIALKNQEMWAVHMLDAWGWPNSAIFATYNPKYVGDFEYCLNATSSTVNFTTKWCGAQMAASEIGPWKFEPNYVIFQMGACVPDSCQPDELKTVITAVMAGLHPEIKGLAAGVLCQERDIPLTTKAKVIIGVASIFAFLLIMGTVYDILLVKKSWHCLLPRAPLEESSTHFTGSGGGDSLNDSLHHHSDHQPLLDAHRNLESATPPSLAHQLLMPFSLLTNTEKLLSTKAAPGTITCIHGIRFLSMTWVILGHTMSLVLQTEDNVSIYVQEATKRWTFQAILSALVSVDTFFLLSGLLMSYLVFKEFKQRRPNPSFFAKFYFHRFWRLTPPYMLVLMTYVPLYKYIGDGPFWPQNGIDKNECEDTWWTNLLYINNLVKADTADMCMGWSWYLANDMQFYVISPFVFLFMYLFGYYGLIAPSVLIVGSMISAGYVSAHFDLKPQVDVIHGNSPDWFKYYYIKPWNRIGPYLVGMIVGYVMSRTECKMRLNKVIVTLGWIFATVVGLSVVYGLYKNADGHPVTTDVAALYNATHRTAWGMAVGWVIFACAHGYGGIVNKILSWSAFIPLSRLTYCAYLIHILVVYFFYFTHRQLFYADNTNITFAFLGTLVIAYMVAYVVSMAYEAPFIGLEKPLIRLFAAIGKPLMRLFAAIGNFFYRGPDL